MENNVSEKILKLELWSPVLKRHSYTFSTDSKVMARNHSSEVSGFLYEVLDEIDRQSQILDEINAPAGMLNPLDMPDFDLKPETATGEKSATKKPKIRKLQRKSKFTIYDYSQVEQGILEDQVNELINQDGYYNEILPLDIDDDYETAQIQKKPLILLIIIVLILLFMLGKDFAEIL